MSSKLTPKEAFGNYVRAQREALGKTVRGLAAELEGMGPTYLNDIENGNRSAPEKHLTALAKALQIKDEEALDRFYDLAGKSRKDSFSDLNPYIGKKPIARFALRRARDLNIPDSKWQEFIDGLSNDEK